MSKLIYNEITSQEELDNFLNKKIKETTETVTASVRAESKKNSQEAANRTELKIKSFENSAIGSQAEIQALQEASAKTKAEYEKRESEFKTTHLELNTLKLSGALAKLNANPKFNEFFIQQGKLTPEMNEEEFKNSFKKVAEQFPELMKNSKTPTAEQSEKINDEVLINTKKAYM